MGVSTSEHVFVAKPGHNCLVTHVTLLCKSLVSDVLRRFARVAPKLLLHRACSPHPRRHLFASHLSHSSCSQAARRARWINRQSRCRHV